MDTDTQKEKRGKRKPRLIEEKIRKVHRKVHDEIGLNGKVRERREEIEKN